jgi:hypothetical protein
VTWTRGLIVLGSKPHYQPPPPSRYSPAPRPSLVLSGHAGRQAGRGRPCARADAVQHPYGAPISLEKAQAAAQTTVAEANRRGWPLNIAVVDSGANLVTFVRMDGADIGGVEIPQDAKVLLPRRPRDCPIFPKIPPDPDIIDVTPMPLAPEPQAPPEVPVRRLPN